MGRMQRNKGKRGEREAAEALRQVLGITARRSVQYQAREDAADLALPELPGVWVEVKRTNRLHLWQVLAEAVRQAGKRVPRKTVPSGSATPPMPRMTSCRPLWAK